MTDPITDLLRKITMYLNYILHPQVLGIYLTESKINLKTKKISISCIVLKSTK